MPIFIAIITQLRVYARGFDFLPMDIYKARARHFQVPDCAGDGRREVEIF